MLDFVAVLLVVMRQDTVDFLFSESVFLGKFLEVFDIKLCLDESFSSRTKVISFVYSLLFLMSPEPLVESAAKDLVGSALEDMSKLLMLLILLLEAFLPTVEEPLLISFSPGIDDALHPLGGILMVIEPLLKLALVLHLDLVEGKLNLELGRLVV